MFDTSPRLLCALFLKCKYSPHRCSTFAPLRTAP